MGFFKLLAVVAWFAHWGQKGVVMALLGQGITEVGTVLENVRAISDRFAGDRHARQRRRYLDPNDFAQLKEAGFLLTGVPRQYGGIFESPEASTRVVSDLLRTLARGDACVALVASMHPAVLYAGEWLARSDVPAPYDEAWRAQREFMFQSAVEGHWWGTITSEPGSGGDVLRTRAVAGPTGEPGRYLLSGQKHFGSGSGVTSFMVTTAVPAGEDAPDWFYLDVRGVPWDGSRGVRLVAEWEGHGMVATQSHAMEFRDFPATRTAHPGSITRTPAVNPGFIPCVFTAVIVGIVEVAMEMAHERLKSGKDVLGAYERTEWTKAQQEAWLIQQAYEGMLREVENRRGQYALRGKTAVAELAESVLTRLCRIMGGGTYAQHSPFGFWFEDVRALGFLRPPWVLAYNTLYEVGFSDEA